MGEFYPDDTNQDRVLSTDEIMKAVSGVTATGVPNLTDSFLLDLASIREACIFHAALSEVKRLIPEDKSLSEENAKAAIAQIDAELNLFNEQLESETNVELNVAKLRANIAKDKGEESPLEPFLALDRIDLPALGELCPNYVKVIGATQEGVQQDIKI